jgi:hypothetical protein
MVFFRGFRFGFGFGFRDFRFGVKGLRANKFAQG